MKTTVLNHQHRVLGAKMVDFGGWDMPLHYGSQIEEHHAVRRASGMFDVSHMCAVDVVGVQAGDFLRKLLANNVDKLSTPGKALYSVMLNERGGVIDDLIVYYLDQTHYRLVINAGTCEKDWAWLNQCLQAWAVDAVLTLRRGALNGLSMIAVQGPHALEKLLQALPQAAHAIESLLPFFAVQVGDYFIARTGYTGESGFEISLPEPQAPALWQKLLELGVVPCGLGARDTLRLEAGMNLYGQEMDEQISPLDAGLAWTVALTAERDFVGKAALQAQAQRYQLLGLLLQEGGVLRAHQRVVSAHGDGEITSGTFSPTLQRSIALARLPLGVAIGDQVQVEIRGRLLASTVLKPKFVRQGLSLVDTH